MAFSQSVRTLSNVSSLVNVYQFLQATTLLYIFQIQESLIECAKQQNLELRFCQELAAAVAQKASSLAGRKLLLTC